MSVIDHHPRAAVFATLVRATRAPTVLSHHAALAADVTPPPDDSREQVSFAVRPVPPEQADGATRRALDRSTTASSAA